MDDGTMLGYKLFLKLGSELLIILGLVVKDEGSEEEDKDGNDVSNTDGEALTIDGFNDGDTEGGVEE